MRLFVLIFYLCRTVQAVVFSKTEGIKTWTASFLWHFKGHCSLSSFLPKLADSKLPGALLTDCNIMAYQGHCRSCSMLVVHRHTCFNLYSGGTQFPFLFHCSCMRLNAHHLCNVYVANRCRVASASGPKDRQTILNFGKVRTMKIENTKHLCQYIMKQEKHDQIFIQTTV